MIHRIAPKNLSYFTPPAWILGRVSGEPEFRILNSLGMLSSAARKFVCVTPRGRALVTRYHGLLIGSFVAMFCGVLCLTFFFLINMSGSRIALLAELSRLAKDEFTLQTGSSMSPELLVTVFTCGIAGIAFGLLLHYDAYRALRDLLRAHNESAGTGE